MSSRGVIGSERPHMEALDLAGEKVVGASEEVPRLLAAVRVQVESIGAADVGKAARAHVCRVAYVQIASGAERGAAAALGNDGPGRVLALEHRRLAALLVHQAEQKRLRVTFETTAGSDCTCRPYIRNK